MKQLNLDKIKLTLERVPEEFENLVAQVGFPSGFSYENGMTVAEVAAINEFGAPAAKVPARPFMRPTIKNYKDDWVKQVASDIPRVVLGQQTAFDALEKLGRVAAMNMKEQITNTNFPPNAPSTVAKKGFNAPLRDTFYMRDTVQNAVNKAGSDFTKG